MRSADKLKAKLLFRRLSRISLFFTLGVILWGAWTRFSHSGDGCGNAWPLCKGQWTPDSFPAFVEWTHRATSGLAFILTAALLVLAFKIYPPGHIARKFALQAGVLMVVEALIGAFLVLTSLTGSSASVFRPPVLAFHLLNSLLLTACLWLCQESALKEKYSIHKPFAGFMFAFLLVALTGSAASLAGTLFPSQTLLRALILDFLPTSHITLKLRPLHPLFALGFVLWVFFKIRRKRIRLFAGAAFIIGAITLFSLSPVFMKLIHLLTAYILWLVLVQSAFRFHSYKKA